MQRGGAVHPALLRPVAVGRQQQLGPLGLVPGLEAPGLEDVARVVAVVVPVDRPVLAVVLPHQAAGGVGELEGEALDQRLGAVEVALLPGGLVGGQAGLALVHVGVLAAVGDELARWRDLVCVGPVGRPPEGGVHAVVGFGHPRGVHQPHARRVAAGQQHEGLAVGHRARVVQAPAVQRPAVQPVGPAEGLEVGERVPRPLEKGRAAGVPVRHRPVEDEARGADEVARAPVVDRAVVEEAVEEAACGVERVRGVEAQDGVDVGLQEGAAGEVGVSHQLTATRPVDCRRNSTRACTREASAARLSACSLRKAFARWKRTVG